MNPEKALRYAVFEALSGNLTLTVDGSGSEVKIFDGPADDENVYVLISNQHGGDESSKHHKGRRVSITLDIHSKQPYNSNYEYVDNIDDQIEAILIPTAQTDGLVAQSGVQFGRLVRDDAGYLPLAISSTQTLMRKVVTYRTTVLQ